MRLNREAGVTIVELMTSLVASSLVIIGAFAVIASQRSVMTRQLQVGASQQGLFVGMELITRDIRKAGMGFGFCRQIDAECAAPPCPNSAQVNFWPRTFDDTAIPQWGGSTTNGELRQLRAIRVFDGGATAADKLLVTFGNPSGKGVSDTGLSGPVNNAALAAGQDIPVLDGSSFMTVSTCCAGGGCTPLAPTAAILMNIPNSFSASPVVPCHLFQVTPSGTTCTTLKHISSTTALLNPRTDGEGVPLTPYNYAADSTVASLGTITQVRYSIDFPSCSTPPCPPPRLMRNDGSGDQLVAEDIEDLQIAVQCAFDTEDTDTTLGPEGADANARKTDDWFFNEAGETITPTSNTDLKRRCYTYPIVRVTLVGRSKTPSAGYQGSGRPAFENRPAGAADDYIRRTLTSTIVAANVGL